MLPLGIKDLLRKFLLVQVFFPGGKTAADVTLGFIDIKHLSGVFCEGGIDLHEALGHVFMYGCDVLERLRLWLFY